MRSAASGGPDGTRHVAAATQVNLGEQPAGGFPGAVQCWVTIDMLAGMRFAGVLADLEPLL